MIRPTLTSTQPMLAHYFKPGQVFGSVRAYSVKSRAKSFNKLIDRIGDEKTKESQKTIKAVRMVGAGSVILVICSLFWASSLTAPVKESPVELGNLAQDVRNR
ncbi:hypothetical protein JCM33374_g1355 [Metschnikowia sp. JCM 33374]|nr:hypothetical protein JCM33374_g1355 [Metschnikowia sp. JCM 33374]